MIQLLVYLVIIVVVSIFLYWLLQQVNLPEPLKKIAMIVLVAIGVIVLIGLLLQFSGGGLGSFRFSQGVVPPRLDPRFAHAGVVFSGRAVSLVNHVNANSNKGEHDNAS